MIKMQYPDTSIALSTLLQVVLDPGQTKYMYFANSASRSGGKTLHAQER